MMAQAQQSLDSEISRIWTELIERLSLHPFGANKFWGEVRQALAEVWRLFSADCEATLPMNVIGTMLNAITRATFNALPSPLRQLTQTREGENTWCQRKWPEPPVEDEQLFERCCQIMDLLALYCHDLHKIFVAIKVECPVEDEGEAMDLPRTLERFFRSDEHGANGLGELLLWLALFRTGTIKTESSNPWSYALANMSNATISTWGFIVAWNHAWNHTLTIADFLIYPDDDRTGSLLEWLKANSIEVPSIDDNLPSDYESTLGEKEHGEIEKAEVAYPLSTQLLDAVTQAIPESCRSMFKGELKTIESTYIEQSWEMTDLGEDLGFEKFCEIDKCLHGGTFQHWLQLRHCFPLETFAGSYDAACQDDSRICFVQMPAVLEPTITALNANLGYDAVRFINEEERTDYKRPNDERNLSVWERPKKRDVETKDISRVKILRELLEMLVLHSLPYCRDEFPEPFSIILESEKQAKARRQQDEYGFDAIQMEEEDEDGSDRDSAGETESKASVSAISVPAKSATRPKNKPGTKCGCCHKAPAAPSGHCVKCSSPLCAQCIKAGSKCCSCFGLKCRR